MTADFMRAMVERHLCEVLETRYSLRLEWVTPEPDENGRSSRYRLRIEMNALDAATRAPVQMHVSIWLTGWSEFPAALDGALRVHLFDTASAAARDRPWTARIQRWADAVRPVCGRVMWAATRH